MDTSDETCAILVAAGASRRMDGPDKIFAPLLRRPLLTYSLSALSRSPCVDAIVLVLAESSLQRGRRLMSSGEWPKLTAVCAGGRRRQDSVRLGLDRLPPCGWVVVHDGARPLLDEAMIADGLAAARTTGASIAAVPVKDTIKMANVDGLVTRTIDRDHLWSVQTPQIFRRDLLADAHRTVSQDVTDDASMVEMMGASVRIFQGSYENLKVTTPDDLVVARSILSGRRRGDRTL